MKIRLQATLLFAGLQGLFFSASGQKKEIKVHCAGEMRKDVKGEAKDETHKVGHLNPTPGSGASAAPGSTAKTTGNLGADENHGNGKNLGDSSRTPKTDNNPNKDGAHNR